LYVPTPLTQQQDGANTDFVSTGPWWIDPNHTTPGPGYLYQIMFAYFGYWTDVGMGPPVVQNLQNAEFDVRIKADNLVIPDGAHLYFYFAAVDLRIPVTDGQIVDYEYIALPIETQLV